MKSPQPLLIVILALAALLVLGQDSAHATSFTPSGTLCLNDQATLPTSVAYAPCDGSKAPSASDAIAARFGIGLGANAIPEAGGGDDTPDALFDDLISFIPPEWGVAAGGDIPDGALVAQFHSIETMGLLGNPCNLGLPVSFDLLDASTNPADTVAVLPPGTQDRLEPLADDNNGNGVFDGAEKWPAYLNDLFDDAIAAGIPDPALNIRARMFGVNTTSVPGTTLVLNFLIFEPGTQLSDEFGVDPRLGYPSVTVLQDPTAPASGQDPVSDMCSPLLTVTNTFAVTKDNPNSPANEAGHDFRTNPSADGGYNFVTYATSLPDADDDGHENPLDPCPFDDDTGWNPRSPSPAPIPGDADADGLPDSCDPNPMVKSPINGWFLDEDLDGWGNRWDNCPVVSNPDNNDEDGDGIGDACDPDPTSRTGHIHATCVVREIDIGAGGTPAIFPHTVQPCDPNASLPGDGEVQIDIKPGGEPNSINLSSRGVIPVAVLTTDTFDASTVDPSTVLFAGASPLRSALEDVDDDGDTDLIMHFRTQDANIESTDTEACLTGETFGEEQIEGCDSVRIVPPTLDTDGDGDAFGDAAEATIGTDQFAACGPKAWPPDINNDDAITGSDVFLVFPAWLKKLGDDGYSQRLDLSGDGAITASDVFTVFPHWLQRCP